MSGGSDGRLVSFVTETEVEAIKKKRQEQWDKVRKPGDPKEAPQEKYDPRPLYERLKEQRDKQQEEWDEKFKFKNMIYQGLDEEEVGFLNLVNYQQSNRDSELLKQERDEINAFKTAVSQLNAEESEKRLSETPLISPTSTSRPKGAAVIAVKSQNKSQHSLIAGGIRRKRTSSESSTGHAPLLDDPLPVSKVTKTTTTSPKELIKNKQDSQKTAANTTTSKGTISCLASYSSSSESSEDEKEEKKKGKES